MIAYKFSTFLNSARTQVEVQLRTVCEIELPPLRRATTLRERNCGLYVTKQFDSIAQNVHNKIKSSINNQHAAFEVREAARTLCI